MENNNISSLILQSTPNSYSLSSIKNEGFFNISWTTWILIIIILALLGFNVFVYLAKGTDEITKFLKPIFGSSLYVGGQIVDVSAEGAKQVINKTADVAEQTLTNIQDITPNNNIKGESYTKPKEDIIQTAPMNQTLNQGINKEYQQNNNIQYQQNKYNYTADNADSSIQGGGKVGWCYIGEDRGFRSCTEVGINDTCMSGDIFPSHEICINPSLRS